MQGFLCCLIIPLFKLNVGELCGLDGVSGLGIPAKLKMDGKLFGRSDEIKL